MVRKVVLGFVAVLALAGSVSACPYDKSAQTSTPATTESSALPLPAPGSTDGTTTTETKTGG